jgi:hypothetical protein
MLKAMNKVWMVTMNENQHLPKHKSELTVIMMAVIIFGLLVGATVLYTLATSATSTSQSIAFLLALAGLMLGGYLALRLLLND